LGTHLTKYAMEPVHNHLKQKKIILISWKDTYSIWLDSAMVYMKKESKRSCATKGVDCEDDSAICRYAHRYYRR
jgi:hypothetical protein